MVAKPLADASLKSAISTVIISKKLCILSVNIDFVLSKQSRLCCGISSGSSLFAIVPGPQRLDSILANCIALKLKKICLNHMVNPYKPSITPLLWDICKQCRHRSDATERRVWSGSPLGLLIECSIKNWIKRRNTALNNPYNRNGQAQLIRVGNSIQLKGVSISKLITMYFKVNYLFSAEQQTILSCLPRNVVERSGREKPFVTM